MTNENDYNDDWRLAAEAEALLALLDAELHADDPSHPDHIAMPSEDEIAEMGKRAFDRAQITATDERRAEAQLVDDDALARVLATWSSELTLVSTTRSERHAVIDETRVEGRAWKVKIVDTELISRVFGAGAVGPLSVTVTDSPVAEGVAVTVTLPLSSRPVSDVELVAVVDYGIGGRTRVPLHEVDLGDAAAQAGVVELSGTSILPAQISEAHPILTLSVLARSS
ncbi:hypothetical protein [Rhodococcus qingshengii]|uniref:hypothetical protein n=1 Tax=Rhodococcus qingshengii TaxID=334542 RepID=UPI0022B3F63A|nr:hypothetical protein [Rhodococcus qingshengii]MCZ4618523.1 hypothetical protein [Rhodococcus qingshengii]